jgi:hypothetical protein
VERFQCITFNVIFGYEHQYTIIALDCGVSFYLKILMLRRILHDIIVNVRGSFVKYPLFSSDFKWYLKFSPQAFERSSNIKFNENPSTENRVIPCGRANGQTDMMKVIIAFLDFAEVSKYECCLIDIQAQCVQLIWHIRCIVTHSINLFIYYLFNYAFSTSYFGIGAVLKWNNRFLSLLTINILSLWVGSYSLNLFLFATLLPSVC